MNWEKNIKPIWEKNGYPSSRRLQTILAKIGKKVDDGSIRKYIRKWNEEIAFIRDEINWDNRGDELWEDMIKKSRRYVKYHLLEPYKVIVIKDKKPIGVSFVSDQHFGNAGVDYDRAKEDAKLIGNTKGLYAILGGDATDNFINQKILPAILNQKIPPIEQVAMLKTYFKWFNGSIGALISGNHEFWTKQFSGLDFYDMLKPELKKESVLLSSYSRHEARISIFFNDIEYRIMIRHKYRFNSAFNLTHTVKRLWEHCGWDFDIGVVCHHHQPSFEPFTRHGKDMWAVRPGSYKVIDDYADQKGFYGVKAACPTAILNPKKKDIQVFKDINFATEYLRGVR